MHAQIAGDSSMTAFSFELFTWDVELDSPIDEAEFKSGAVFLSSQRSDANAVKPVGRRASSNPSSLLSNKRPRSNACVVTAKHEPIIDEATGEMHIENCVGRFLRPHQREGVEFMYRCVSGRKGEFTGCVLADSMGLGKTLQVISLLWTMIAAGEVKKALVAAPSSLVSMWRLEVRKWLGNERLPVCTVEAGPAAVPTIEDFLTSRLQRLIVISYDMLRKHAAEFTEKIDMLVLDEAHRLKENSSKTMQSLERIRCPRRLLLTGTPIQNNLMEFHSLMSFAVGGHGLLGNAGTFRRTFMDPINLARDRDASSEAVDIGRERASELARVCASYMLRRENTVLEAYLPKKREFTIFCSMSDVQRQLYGDVIKAVMPALMHARTGNVANQGSILGALSLLGQLASHPSLISAPAARTKSNNGDGDVDGADKENDFNASSVGSTSTDASGVTAIRAQLGKKWSTYEQTKNIDIEERGSVDVNDSGKFTVLASLLEGVVTAGEKVVVTSTSTSILNAVGALCDANKWSTVRLDGSTAADKREAAVRIFNSTESSVVFLLSKKAGGVGLTLTGGNHLVLVDTDWNPAADAQALARIFREGQTRESYIYRLVTAYSIEEKQLQRQISKTDISSNFLKESASLVNRTDDDTKFTDSAAHFSRKELAGLFKLRGEGDGCDTLTILDSVLGHGRAAWTDRREAVKAEGMSVMSMVMQRCQDVITYLHET